MNRTNGVLNSIPLRTVFFWLGGRGKGQRIELPFRDIASALRSGGIDLSAQVQVCNGITNTRAWQEENQVSDPDLILREIVANTKKVALGIS